MKSASALLKEAYDMIKSDRALTKEAYDKFSSQVNNVGDYVVAGQNLNKCIELLSKQSAQLLELAKLADAMAPREEHASLTAEDIENIYSH